jgi:hypothetical protein
MMGNPQPGDQTGAGAGGMTGWVWSDGSVHAIPPPDSVNGTTNPKLNK